MLTQAELSHLIGALAGRAPSPTLVASLRRRIEHEPHALAGVVRCLVAPETDGIGCLERLAAQTTDDACLFRRIGDYWEVGYAGQVVLVRHGKGLGYLARLLARPGERVP